MTVTLYTTAAQLALRITAVEDAADGTEYESRLCRLAYVNAVLFRVDGRYLLLSHTLTHM